MNPVGIYIIHQSELARYWSPAFASITWQGLWDLSFRQRKKKMMMHSARSVIRSPNPTQKDMLAGTRMELAEPSLSAYSSPTREGKTEPITIKLAP